MTSRKKRVKKPEQVKLSSGGSTVDSKIYIGMRWFGFVAASVVSAFFNIFLISGLDRGYFPLLCGISLTLEITKISTLISGNVFNELSHQIKSVSIAFKKKLFYGFYVMFALFSIFCSLAFSLTITDKKDLMDTAEGMRIQSSIEVVQSKLDEIEAVKQLSKADIFTHPDYVAADDEVKKFQVLFDEADTNDTVLSSKRRGILDTSSPEYVEANRAYNENRTLRQGYLAQLNQKKAILEVQRSRLESIKEDSSQELDKLNGELEAFRSQFDIQTPNPIIELKARYEEYERTQLENSGSEKMFVILANMFNTVPHGLKFVILLFLSVLIELTVWMCGPDIQVTPSVLRFFRKSLPQDVEITEVIKAFKKEYNKFQDFNVIEEERENAELEEAHRLLAEKETEKNEIEGMLSRVKARELEYLEEKADLEKRIQDLEHELEVSEPSERSQELNEEVAELKKELEYEMTKREEAEKKAKSKKDYEKVLKEKSNEIESLKSEIESLLSRSVKEVIEAQPVKEDPIPVAEEEKDHLESSSKGSIRYRFGLSSERVKDKLIEFVSCCVDQPGQFKNTPEWGAKQSHINETLMNTYLNRLNVLKLHDEPLVYSENDKWYSTVDLDTLITYSTEILS